MTITRLLRVVHRDLGFFVVGITLVYGISGILLNHLGGKDPAFSKEMHTIQFPVEMTENELTSQWQAAQELPVLKRINNMDKERFRLFLDGGVGIYNATTGYIEYETYKKRHLIYWINRLHYNKVKWWSPVADFFAGALILLAISGLFMVKGKRGLAGSGKWYLIIGIIIPVLFVIFFLK